SSGPIPAGSPIVIASGARSTVMTGAPTGSGASSNAGVGLDVAERAQHQFEHQGLAARRRIVVERPAGSVRERHWRADARRIADGERRALVLVADPDRIADRIEHRRLLPW